MATVPDLRPEKISRKGLAQVRRFAERHGKNNATVLYDADSGDVMIAINKNACFVTRHGSQ